MRTALNQLEQVKVSKAQVSVLTVDVKKAQASLAALSSTAGSQWTSQISGVTTALDQLRGAATSAASKPSVTAIASVVTAVGGVKTAATALISTVKASCPNIDS